MTTGCAHCGAGLPAGAAFCPACGKPVAPGRPWPGLPSRLGWVAAAAVGVVVTAVLVLAFAVSKMGPGDLVGQPGLYVVFAFLQGAAFVLLIRLADVYEREPLGLVALVAVWGATGAVMLALLGNTAVTKLLPHRVQVVFGDAITAPLVEECAKGAALVAVLLGSRWLARRLGTLEFEGVTDGIVYGAAIGMGFALAEDIFYFFRGDSLQQGLDILALRVDLFGLGMLGHSLYTAAFGAGLGLATLSRSRRARIGFPLLGLAAAMLMHATWNGLGSLVLVGRFGFDATAAALDGQKLPIALVDQMKAAIEEADRATELLYEGFLVACVVGFVLWLRYQRQVLHYELAEEVRLGLVDPRDWELLPGPRARATQWLGLLRAGRFEEWSAIRRFQREVVELAFLKWRLRRLGGDWSQVDRRRQRIARLRAEVTAPA